MCKSTFLNLENSRQILTKKPLTVRHYFASTPTPHSAVKRLSFIQKHSDTTVCYYHVMYEFQRNLHSIVCLNVKEPLAGSRRHMWSLSDSNGIRTHNYVVRKRTLNHLVKLAKWLSCVVSAYLYGAFEFKEFLDIQATIECSCTMKLVRDMIITYIQMHRTDTYSQHSLIIWPVWLNGWVFVYELNSCGFESCCFHLNSSNTTWSSP